MKKLIIFFVLITLGIGGSVFAEPRAKFKESEYYYVNLPIEKIYVYRKGYMVIYRRGAHSMARTFIPEDWFTDASGKGELIGMGSGREWPSMTVYYRNGEFSHVRLRVRRAKGHVTWGVIPLNVNIDDQFKDIEEVKLEF